MVPFPLSPIQRAECVSNFALSRMDRAYNPPALKLQPHLARTLRQTTNELGRC